MAVVTKKANVLFVVPAAVLQPYDVVDGPLYSIAFAKPDK